MISTQCQVSPRVPNHLKQKGDPKYTNEIKRKQVFLREILLK